ncbi:hypothetical protein ACLB2K_021407 [Fragaria x ananassa]
MEDSREILLNSLASSGVCVPYDVSSVRDLTPATLVSICGQSLNLIAKTSSFPTSLPDSSVADQFNVCMAMASGIQSLGYVGDMSFHKFLYPSEEDSCKLVRFLVERLSESSGSGSRGDLNDMGRVKEDGFESDLASQKSGEDRLAPKWDEFRLNGEVPEVLDSKGENASGSCVANHMLQRLEEMSIDKVSSRPGDAHSSEEKQLTEEVTAKTLELKHLEEELELLKAAVAIAFDVDRPTEFYLEELNQQVDARKKHIGELKLQQEEIRRPLVEKRRYLQETLSAGNPDAQKKMQKLKQLELEKESILAAIHKREEELSQLSGDLEKQPKVASRRSYIERVKEITKNSRKQEADIEQILKDTRELQLESNSIQERLHRTYAVVDELMFREAKKDAVGRQAYRLLASIHESFEQIREKILATDRIRREATGHEKKLASMASRSLNADKLQADLEVIRRENEYLEKSLQDK